MRRILVVGVVLLLSGALVARSLPLATGKPAASAKSDLLIFVFLRVDRAQDVAILRPMIAPDIGVQLDTGPRNLDPGTVLRCGSSVRAHDAIVEGQAAKVSDVVLDCGEQKFVVKTIDFSPQR